MAERLSEREYWRALILYGLNTATYKIALGQALANFVRAGRTNVSMHDLAAEFLALYRQRLKTSNQPQLILPGRQTVMERVNALIRAGRLTEENAVDVVERNAFHDVIPRFHTLGQAVVPVRFYEVASDGIVLTDSAFRVLAPRDGQLLDELDARWALLEAAFAMRREALGLRTDLRRVYLVRGYDRTHVAKLRPVLNGYQNGRCFYCDEEMGVGDVHVDHVIPRQFVQHDEIWNLVLAHGLCNKLKSDALPPRHYVVKLIRRNEQLVASKHPVREKVIAQLGPTPDRRADATWRIYTEALSAIGYTWDGLRGYDPDGDLFYKMVVRSVT